MQSFAIERNEKGETRQAAEAGVITQIHKGGGEEREVGLILLLLQEEVFLI
jgi:hypothetical protein